VSVLGTRPREEIAALMRAADFLFFPSEMEPCPNTPLEAIASGLPPLYHPSGGTPELLGDAAVAMTDDLGADVARLLAGRDGWRARALERAAAFTAERATREYADVMRQAVVTPPRTDEGKRRSWTLRGF
jgi:glycosyltransferase involved in cell wall biosynthesis